MSAAVRSRIFVRNATVLDAAILDPQCGPRGRSWYVDVTWQGTLNDEGVVFDFAHAKRAAKEIIDALFDHRLIVAKSMVTKTDSSARDSAVAANQTRNVVSVGAFTLDTYPSALAVVDDAVLLALCEQGDLTPLATEIARRVKEGGPSNVESVGVTLRDHEQASEPHFFAYTHSLRLHAGNCQRFHGHSNVVEVFRPDGKFDLETSLRAARTLAGRYLVAPEYLKDDAQGDATLARVSYEGSQGRVHVTLPRTQLLVLPEEASIENIALFLARELNLPEGWSVHAFEGLAKGAVAPLP